MVSWETLNQSRRSIPIAVEDSATTAMRFDKLWHMWLCRYYSSWFVMAERRWHMYKTDLGYITDDSMVRSIPFPKPNTQTAQSTRPKCMGLPQQLWHNLISPPLLKSIAYQPLKTLSTHCTDFVCYSSLINLPVLINAQRRGSRWCFYCWM